MSYDSALFIYLMVGILFFSIPVLRAKRARSQNRDT